MTTIRFDDNRGDFAYPFLPADLGWRILSRPLSGEEALEEIASAPIPTLRWVKDDKALDLIIPDPADSAAPPLSSGAFLEQAGLRLSLEKGGYVLAKRLSRIMRPYRYWGFFSADDLTLDYNHDLDPRLWDGSGQVSRGFIQRLADRLYPERPDQPRAERRRRRELLTSNRFEVTTLHSGGQDKGHVYVVDDLAVDFMFPAGSAKEELQLHDGRVFVGLHPVHSADQMCLDAQSLINLHPFFQPEQLLAWLGLESELFLASIRDGRLQTLLDRLYSADSPDELEALADWHLGDYIASGGRLMWFAGMVKAAARQHLNRLGGRASKLRAPLPGGRYYLFPAAIGGRNVPPGQVELDPASATAWVNDQDWLSYIVSVLGGCDGDDAVWVFPFRDRSAAGERRVLLWRSPNQVGEYILLRPTANSHRLAWQTAAGPLSDPALSSDRLPPRIDSQAIAYGSLTTAATDGADSQTAPPAYSIAAMAPTIEQAAVNQGVLGSHCNALMLCKALYGRLPDSLPATLEAVIDGSVKSGLDLRPVRQWNKRALRQMARHGQRNPRRVIPESLLERLPEWLRPTAEAGRAAAEAAGQLPPHWLDSLCAALERHKAQYWAEVEALAAEACPPAALFEQARDWLQPGKELRQVYSRVIRQALALYEDEDALPEAVYDEARQASEAYLARWPEEKRPFLLLGAAAYLYAQGPTAGEPVRDGAVWQLGARREGASGREPGIAQGMVAALRQIGLLGEPVWTTAGALLHYRDEPAAPPPGVPLRLNGTWFNLANVLSRGGYQRMGDMPPAEQAQAKARVAEYARTKFPGMALYTRVTDDNRVVATTAQGNLFGYVQRDHELAAIRHDQWRIAWATAVDGNVWAVVQPA
jgi:hypothetical protein